MRLGTTLGARGEDVARLHRALAAAGLAVDRGEFERQELARSTLEALHALQRERGLRETDAVDEATLAVLLELEAKITIRVEPAPGQRPPPKPDEHRGRVHGKLVDGDGAPLPKRKVAVFARQLRSEALVGDGATSAEGVYQVAYARRTTLNLKVRAYDEAGQVIAESSTVFAAPAQVEIDLTTAKDGVVRSPSRFTRLEARIEAVLHGTPFEDLKENKDEHELRFLANAIGAPFTDVAYAFLAHLLASPNSLREETLFGIFYQGIPAPLDAALGALPDAGIDSAFSAQVLTGVLGHARGALDHALTTSLVADILPASYADVHAAELDRIDALRVQQVAQTPYIRGKTPLTQLLAAGSLGDTVKTAFVKAFADSGGRLGPTWKALRADKTLAQADLAALQTTLSVGELLNGNMPLVTDTLQRLSGGSLARVQDLARLDESDWVARITEVDPTAQSIPPVLPNDPPAQRIARFAKALAQRFAGRYPSAAFAGGLSKATASAFAAKDELIAILGANPSLNLKRTNLDQYVAKNEVAISAPALAELKTAQRLLRISPHYTTVEALKSAGYTSAQSVYFEGREPFVAKMTAALGSAPLAKTAYARAQMTYAAAMAMFAQFNLSIQGTSTAATTPPVPDPGTLASLPDLQALFGPLDYFDCRDCQSVYSPAAYLVDLLQYLRQFNATPLPNAPAPVLAIGNARDALLFRRPEIQYLALDCSNTDVTLPYIDLVNEILEAFLVSPAPHPPPPAPPYVIDTLGTSDERRALPQTITADAYDKTKAAIFPLTLPFDLAFAQTTAYLGALGTSRAAILALFAGAAGQATATDVACASLGISHAMQLLLDGGDGHALWERWGLSSANPPYVVNPKTRTRFVPSDWVAALNVVPVLLNRAGLSLRQLYQLLEVAWVTQSSVTLQLGVVDGMVSADTNAMTFTGLTSDVLDRAQRFLRLLAASGLTMWELDWALSGRSLDDAFLGFLSGALAVRDQLKLPLQELLGFWGPLETRDVTSHLGDEDTVVPSTYTSVFANPTLRASWPDVFPPVPSQPPPFELNGQPILPPQPTPTPAQSANLSATMAALGLHADDIAAILAATTPPTANVLKLDVVNVLSRHARLASALSMPVQDLLLWIQLTAGTPFGTTPADTLEFLRRLAVLRGTGLSVHDLDYLLRNGSEAQTALAFTTAQSTTLLQGLRDALAKLTPEQRGDPPTVATVFIAALAAATNVTANVVTPVVNKLAILPLPAATVTQLVQSATVDPNQFPQLVAAFVAVAKAAALYHAIGASESEFAFLVDNASTFGWLDPSALSSAATSPYAAFESLLRAVKLNRRQSARTPKLFDVLGAWVVPGQLPADPQTAIQGTATVPALADALRASVDDVKAIAGALGASAPSLTAATQPGSLADTAMLSSIAAALDLVHRYGLRGTTLVSLAAPVPDAGTAAAARGAFQAQYPQSAWFGAVQPVEDGLRQARRDALVAYLLGPGAELAPMNAFLTTDDVFDYFLIDPEMAPCAVSTRLLQASLAVQQFVQQCFLNLSIQVTVDTTASAWSEWSWRQQFRLWQANRQVFLYPENYVLPELRKDASPFFEDLESDLRQNSSDAALAETSLQNYLRKLVEASRLVIAAHYNQTMPDGSTVLHVFAHTRGTPYKWFYRARTTRSPGAAGVWAPWQALNLDIAVDQLIPVVWDRRLHIVWPIFKPETEKQRDQDVPQNGGGTQSAPAKFWAIDFAISELSAGKWQPKRVLTEKMFLSKNLPGISVDLIDRPPIAFTFRAAQDPSFDLVLTVYYNLSLTELIGEAFASDSVLSSTQAAVGTLSMLEAPMKVRQDTKLGLLPASTLVDLSQEPSYALVASGSLSGSLTTPTGYNFSGQDLVHGFYFQPDTGTVPLYVLSQTSAYGSPASVELLGTVVNPRVVVPQQEAVFDSLDPFFVEDGGGGSNSAPRPVRTYLVQPEFYTVSSSPQELTDLAYVRQWTTRYDFQSFYHPYARTMLRELESGGVSQLMSRTLQTDPQGVRGWSTKFDFAAIFQPQPPVATPYPGQPGAIDVGETALDFATGSTGAYSLYNWEVFYHAPMFAASLLMQNQQYADAMTWLEYIFDPTDTSTQPAPQRYWQTAPFNAINAPGASGWVNQQIQTILSRLSQGITDPDTAAALATWMADPFDPHAIASLRISAYAKATVMKFLDNLIAWGDSLFSTYTAETVSQAEQLYILADLILGPQPDQVRLPPASTPSAPPLTYAQIAGQLDAFSNVLVSVENLVVAPAPPQAVVQGTAGLPSLPQFPGTGKTLFFCIPPNDKLLSYWTTVADRLYKIRHCLNLRGQAVPLPLYAPPINPLLAAQQAAAGQTPSGLSAPPPIYRFATYLQKAVELANDVRSFGALILGALEKEDAETLALLRANQELDIQTRMLDVKSAHVDEANDQITALQNQKAVAKVRYDYYSSRTFMNDAEKAALKLHTIALLINGLAIPLDLAASVAHLVPSFSFGVEGFGGSPAVTASWGGGNIASSVQAAAGATRATASLLTELAGMVTSVGSYQRRMDDWQLQTNLASAEMMQVDSQIAAANDRLKIATTELDIQQQQVNHAQDVSDFLTNKYTNAELYDWMLGQLTTVYTQAYQLAFSLAQQAQNAYQFELGRPQDVFLQLGYWDNQHKGLTAGEKLLFDLRRMESQFLVWNARELELTKHVSLALTQPMALVQLMETGSCEILLDEALFDADHPGHFFRRLRNVAVTVPCVTGPYTGVHATLTLATSVVRTTSTLPAAGYVPASAKSPPADTATFAVTSPNAIIATSTGQNDSGLFDVNMRDERYLPFEGQGAVSRWTLELNPASNNFDFSTITDVVLHVRYTARAGIDEGTVLQAVAPPSGVARSVLVSAKSTFGDDFYRFLHPTDTTATQQVLNLPFTDAIFPWSNLAGPKIQDIQVFLALTQPPDAGTNLPSTFGPSAGAGASLTLTDALPPGWTGSAAVLYGDASVSPSTPPQAFTWTVKAADIPPKLAATVNGQTLLDASQIEDVVLLVSYLA